MTEDLCAIDAVAGVNMSPGGVPVADFEPRIVAFLCNWCTYTTAELDLVSRLECEPNARIVRVMCSGRVDPQFVLDAFANGADGVLVGGCHPGDCHYQDGNYKALRRMRPLRRVLDRLGIEDARFRLEWISASEEDKVRSIITEMVEQVRALGPLRLSSGAVGDQVAGT